MKEEEEALIKVASDVKATEQKFNEEIMNSPEN